MWCELPPHCLSETVQLRSRVMWSSKHFHAIRALETSAQRNLSDFFQLFKQHCQENGKIKLTALCFWYLLKALNPELSRVTLLCAPCGHCIILRYKATSLVSLTSPTTGHSSGQPGIEGRGQATAGGLQVCHRSKSSIFMWDDSTSEHHSPSGCAS